MNTTNHPVWTVYDKLRTARLNVKYYERRTKYFQSLNTYLEIFIAIITSSVFANLFFWTTEAGQNVLKILTSLAAFAAIIKPILKHADLIKKYEKILSGYRILEYDLREIKCNIEQTKSFDAKLKKELEKALKREKELVSNNPEIRQNSKVKKICELEVLKEFPTEIFFIPEETSHV